MDTSPSSTSLLYRSIDPIRQVLLVFSAVVVFNLVAAFVRATGIMEVSPRFHWTIAAAFMLLFAMLNSVLSLSTKNMKWYWGRSVYCFIGLAAASGLLAWLFSSLSIGEAGSYRWIYIVLTIGYLVFLSIVSLMRGIVDFAQREEWSQPRLRHRKPRR
ncbi:MAG: hypothetical protein HUU34_11210 [Saprospiraceae bacterium]|nr:hypothetical protein [Saprospiraceae bacterium]